MLIKFQYEKAADRYLRSLKLENLMEAPPQATQREITLESLALVKALRSDFQVFNELLVQYPGPGPRKRRLGQVVPDNMVVLWPEPLKVERSYNLPLQPCGPFWVMEYVSTTNRRKDYDESMPKYEQELKVPYYLLFAPENQELSLFHHNGTRYDSVLPDEHGRHAIPEVEMEVALLDGWVRYWHQGRLLPLPAELQADLNDANRRAEEAARRAESADRRAETAEAEVTRLLAELAALKKQQGG
jgi:Uma2 family endonuclease